jgi:RNA polymerase sigma-70 factor, ECF subfamily
MQFPAHDLVKLMERVAQRDRDAFASLYEATSAKLFGIVLRILRRRDLADEVLQEVYIKVWQQAAAFDARRSSAMTWMAAIARNAALDVARRRTPIPFDDAPEVLDIEDPGQSALQGVMQREEATRLHRCIEGLDPMRQEIVRLAYLHGLSREELSARYRHPVATIKTWLHRSLKQLKDCLGT